MDTKFWEDTWLGNKSLAEQYPSLYNILKCKQVSVANVLNQNPLNISFRAYFKRKLLETLVAISTTSNVGTS
jgi:hypothetical protein